MGGRVYHFCEVELLSLLLVGVAMSILRRDMDMLWELIYLNGL